MRKTILLNLAIILTAMNFSPASAQIKSGAATKTREVNIYLYRSVEAEPTSILQLLEVKRRVDARAPLRKAIRALLAGATPAEVKNGMFSFIYGIELESVRIKNNVARVDFKFDDRTNSWLDPTMEALFNEAMERTATQFSGVKRVLVCVDGIENFFLSKQFQKKCPKNWTGDNK
jgi:spore germination protein GerM